MSEQLELMVDLLQAKKNGRSCRRSYTWCCCRWSWRWRWRWRSCKWRLRCRWSCYCFSEHFSTNRSITRFIFLTWRSHDLWLFPAVQTLQSLRTKLVCHECNIPDGDPGAKGGGGGVKMVGIWMYGGGLSWQISAPISLFSFFAWPPTLQCCCVCVNSGLQHGREGAAKTLKRSQSHSEAEVQMGAVGGEGVRGGGAVADFNLLTWRRRWSFNIFCLSPHTHSTPPPGAKG